MTSKKKLTENEFFKNESNERKILKAKRNLSVPKIIFSDYKPKVNILNKKKNILTSRKNPPNIILNDKKEVKQLHLKSLKFEKRRKTFQYRLLNRK